MPSITYHVCYMDERNIPFGDEGDEYYTKEEALEAAKVLKSYRAPNEKVIVYEYILNDIIEV